MRRSSHDLVPHFSAWVGILECLATFAWARVALLEPEHAHAAGLVWVSAVWILDGYSTAVLRRPRFLGRVLPVAAAVSFLLLSGLTFGLPRFANPLWLVVWLTELAAIRGMVALVLICDVLAERVVVVGNSALAQRLCAELRRKHAAGNVSQAIGDRELDARLAASMPERVIVACEEGSPPDVQRLLALRLKGVAIEHGSDALERLTGAVAMDIASPERLLFSVGFYRSRVHGAVSRAISLLAAVMGLVVLGPLIILLAVLVKLESRGPALFIHPRMGLGGRTFPLLKFRTMRDADGPRSEWVGDNADRITPVGRVLRRFRLDELPQLLNVARGDMNLIGPRPHPARNIKLFSGYVPYYGLRCLVRPGITGWAQVRQGYANGLDEEIQKMGYDLYYIKHASLTLDLRIVLATIPVLLLSRGSEPTAQRSADAPWALSR